MRLFSLGCIAKCPSSGELAVLHTCDNSSTQLALTSFTRGKLLALSLSSSHCAIFMSTLKVSEVHFCSNIFYLGQCSSFTLFLHLVSFKKKNDAFRSRAELNSQEPANSRTGRKSKITKIIQEHRGA